MTKVSPNAGSIVAVEALLLARSEVQFCLLVPMDAVILNLILLVLLVILNLNLVSLGKSFSPHKCIYTQTHKQTKVHLVSPPAVKPKWVCCSYSPQS